MQVLWSDGELAFVTASDYGGNQLADTNSLMS